MYILKACWTAVAATEQMLLWHQQSQTDTIFFSFFFAMIHEIDSLMWPDVLLC